MRSPCRIPLSANCMGCKFRENGFFCQLSPLELKDFDAIKFVSAYRSKAILFVRGQKPRGVYVLCRGRVKLSFTSREGKTLILKIARPGEVLGLASALSGRNHELTAKTMRPSQVAFVPVADFQQFLRKHPDVFVRVASHLGREYKTACDQLYAVGLGASTFERVARFLLNWSLEEGAREDGARFELPLTHEVIAEYTGVTRESVTRALSEFKSRGLVQRNGSTVVIAHRAALAEFRWGSESPHGAGPRLLHMSPIRQGSASPTGPPLPKRVAHGTRLA